MNIETIKRRSQQALCGAFEKQISVKPSEVAQVKRTLREHGFIIVGDGPAGFGNVNIWYNPAGLNF
jgi:hypothetical protein